MNLILSENNHPEWRWSVRDPDWEHIPLDIVTRGKIGDWIADNLPDGVKLRLTKYLFRTETDALMFLLAFQETEGNFDIPW